MKNYPLAVQIWIVIAMITLSISILLAFILPSTLRDFFTREIYASIHSAQDLVFNQFDSNIYRDYIGSDFFGKDEQVLENIRTVKHFIIYDDNKVIISSKLPTDFLKKVQQEALTQENVSQEYSGDIDGGKVFYIISKGKALGRDAFLVSYMSDSYREDLVETLFKKLINLMGLVFLFSWIPAILLSRYLSRPLVDLERKVGKLANNEWNEPIELNRKDEIGKLGFSIEYLRKQLIRQDEAEQSFLQHVSHELKTPVMVIQSFTQAIKDGIYPKGTLEDSIDTIDDEAKRLEKKIKNLLYLTKLDYLSNHEIDKINFSLDSLIKDIVDRFSWHRADINWSLDLMPISIVGDVEQWKIVIENLLDNQMRYANSKILISLKKVDNKTILKIWNDGPAIEEKLLKTMFNKFNKGYKGEFGLGLAIAYKVVKSHNSNIFAINEKEGVSFYIEIFS
ncbi:two-component system, OmpR family, sensor histidine kinase CssS [Tissierella praeacuta DSM 18095]|uniref:histidine kinase n=1 Tax=Tissierella praeacuta DSM 18095 TaxID=1123404 RepID=A0A1M4T907_9FIRM|nr:HAMP domain-containing sensor histidine kinase [Tissierella praeacuta]SHE41042.1 two-component system, OmpR family, sensor histidine kinase CssS [Tissierella praeacuta DSM 18095]SUP04833.1 Sensor histidine kinase CssS [Tissierella praeacuta]